jgi:hypothetical protein
VLDAAPIHDLALLLELLTAGAVEPLVFGDVQIVGVQPPDPLEQLGYGTKVARLSGADPVVVATAQSAPELGEARRHAVDPLLRLHARPGRGLQDGLAVFVHSHEKMDLISAEPPVARDRVGADLLQGVAQVRVTVGVVDRSGQVELGHARGSAWRALAATIASAAPV